ncbi:hypothetical protein [Paenibacillus sp. R14(2021)]|uniref:hypothetical protein n=1 Tax=Paenibacillus sp. R14(2021) TaxID=2859228 RepID=UPI001C613112|nr:hypothetical protein [Paenibacillus sp. R14(2021)]
MSTNPIIAGEPANPGLPAQPRLLLPNSPNWNSFKVAAVLALACAGAFLGAWYLPRGYNLAAVLAMEAIIVFAIGKGKMNHPLGILINERNLMSLSRLQMTMWTVLFTSVYFTLLVSYLAEHPGEQLHLTYDSTILALMGVSAFSTVFSPMIQGAKKNRTIERDLKEQLIQSAADVYNMQPAEIASCVQGTLYANPSFKDAQFSDIFEGEEMQNHAYIDVAKVQLFMFSATVYLAYGAMLFTLIITKDPGEITKFPELPSEVIGLLGISNGGYLTSKVINFTKSTP